MTTIKRIKVICLISLIVIHSCFVGCVELYDAETQVFEGVLVVEARFTDEVKQHQVLLSRARPFEQDSITAEANAIVVITDDLGDSYDFTEVEPGNYLSNLSFGAEQNKSYHLSIKTNDGIEYNSESVDTPKKASINRLYAEKVTQESEDGVGIFLDNESPSNDQRYFRLEYEEAYKIIAPFWDPFEFDIIDDVWFGDEDPQDPYEVGIKPKEQQDRICYGQTNSNRIIQTTTKGLTENSIERFLVHFINENDYIISHRYSILVKQYAQSLEAFNYYQRLNEFSSSDGVFTNLQPGFLEGNIRCESDIDLKVIGYFEVTSVSSERIFFNYTDLYPDQPLPPYYINCEPIGEPLLYVPAARGSMSPLIDAIRDGTVRYYVTNEDFDMNDLEMIYSLERGPYGTKAPACGDCTVLGSNIVPDFWQE